MFSIQNTSICLNLLLRLFAYLQCIAIAKSGKTSPLDPLHKKVIFILEQGAIAIIVVHVML